MSSNSRGVYLFLLCVLYQLFLQTDSTPSVDGPSLPTIEGESVSLNCSFNYQVQNVTWLKDGVILNDSSVSISPLSWSLFIPVTNGSLHNGTYSCRVNRIGGQQEISDSFPLTIYYIHGSISVCEVHENRALISHTTTNSGVQTYTVGLNTETTLTCCLPYDSNPPINTIQWTHVDSPINDGIYRNDRRTLVIDNVEFNDRGDYTCGFEHVVRNGTSTHITLRVVAPESTPATPVSVDIPQSVVCVKPGSNVTLPCTVRGTVRPNEGISWSKGSIRLTTSFKYTISVTHNSLTIHEVALTDKGVYKCQATGNDNSDSDTVHLETNCITSVTITPPHLTTGIGTTRTLTCTGSYSNAVPLTYHWTLPNGTNITGRELQLTNIQFSDNGTYQCTVNSPLSQSRTSSVLLLVEGRPLLPTTVVPMQAKLYHNLTLFCITNTSTPSQFTWTNGSSVISPQNGHVYISSDQTSSILTIKTFTKYDVGVYHCNLDNPNHVPKSTSINVSLSTDIYLWNDFSDQYGYVNHEFSIGCPVLGGVRDIEVTWYNGSTRLLNSFEGVVIENRENVSYLKITSLRLFHEGSYSCRATDRVSNFVKIFNITVNIPGRFINTPEDTTVQEGEYLQIDCIATGKPQPNITILPHPSSHTTTVHTNGSIIFKNLSMSDSGRYLCFFKNSGPLGSVEQMSFNLRVLPREVTPTAASTDSTILGLQQNAFIFFVLAAVGVFFIILIILLLCIVLCVKCCCKRNSDNNGVPKAILDTTSFERRPSLRGSLRGSLRKDNSGILAHNPDRSSLWTFTTENTTSIPMTGVSSSVAVSPGPPVPSPIPPPDGPTASLATELQLPGNITNFPRQNLRLSGDIMGEGEFGPVFKGIARHITDGEEETLVAVKVLMSREGESVLWPSLMDFASQMKLSSPFVSRILGICAESEPFYVIYQYLNRGDLKRFLINSHPTPLEPPPLNQTDLLDIISQISEGMRYLYTQQIIHGDLATRNCLVGSDLSVKIADLGIGHDLYEQDYYDNSTQLLPIRWMAPELLRESEIGPSFSLASDIWSFGIFCWEVFSYARQPYEELTDEQVLNLVPEGHLLNSPEEGMPPLLYSLLMDCWQSDSLSRPLFTEIAPAVRGIEVD